MGVASDYRRSVGGIFRAKHYRRGAGREITRLITLLPIDADDAITQNDRMQEANGAPRAANAEARRFLHAALDSKLDAMERTADPFKSVSLRVFYENHRLERYTFNLEETIKVKREPVGAR
jgi:hypothetical protein